MRVFWAAAMSVALMSGAAFACQPDPLPEYPSPEIGERAEAYAARIEAIRAEERAIRERSWISQQQSWWDDSEFVFIARVERVGTVRLDFGETRRAHLRPVQWLKGEGRSRRFSVNHEGWTSCGPFGRGGDAASGEVGETFVVFARQSPLRLENLVTAVSPSAITHPDILALLPAQASAAVEAP